MDDTPLTEAVPDTNEYWRQRSYTDFYERSLVGPMYHTIACWLLVAMGEYSPVSQSVILVASLIFLALWWLRRANHLPTDFADIDASGRWSQRHWRLIQTGKGVWAMVAIVIAFDHPRLDLEMFTMGMLICIFGNATSVVFTADAQEQKICLSILHWPVILVAILFSDLRGLAVILLLHWFWCTRSALKLANEYKAQINIEHALLLSRSEVQALARTDVLTGLANRREYIAMLNWACNSAQRNHTALSLAVIDLDHFKAVNDRYGHAAGDACLKHVAGMLRHHFRRAGDFVARIGGEEFVAVLPSTTVDVAHRICEEFRLALLASSTLHEGQSIPITASIGVGEVAVSKAVSLDDNFARIDAATYQAKAGGRNQTVIAAAAPVT